MNIITKEQVEDLNRIDKLIQKYAKKFGLDFYPQEFDIISSEKMAEIIAYSFPVTYHHWSGGRDYEREKTLWRYDRQKLPYEVVFNTDPCRAYLCETDPFIVIVMAMAHVYAHNDFDKNNHWSKTQRPDINRYLAAAHERFEEYEKKYGFEAVEKTITAALSIKFNIDPFSPERPDTEAIIEKKIKEAKKKNPKADIKKLRKEIQGQIPFEPDRDLIGFIAEHAPDLEPWQRDILMVIREQGYYQFPYFRTQIMNEGWAVFWHEKIMTELIKAQLIEKEDREIYMATQSRVLASHPLYFNPYLVGREIWKYIEREYGKEKLFQIRTAYRDIEFVDEFLTDEVIHDLKLYIYQAVPWGGEIFYVIVEKRPKVIREMLVNMLKISPGIPIISVLRGNHNNQNEIYLYHHFDEMGMSLDEEYREKTMEHIFELWGKTVWLETKEKNSRSGIIRPIIYSFNGKDHKQHSNTNQITLPFKKI